MNVKRIIRGLLFCLFVVIAFFGIFQVTSKVVKAETFLDQDVLANPTPGIKLDGYFTTGTFAGNPSYVMNSNGVDIVRMTSDKNQTGAIWSNNDKNYLDVTKKQTLSMWVYFGNMTSNIGIPDGMAFVLQNDNRGAEAISKRGSTVNNGETLGVWGSDYGTTPIQDQAIQNSFALEFDTYTNSATATQGNSFDSLAYTGINHLNGPGHIAWSLPGESTTYQKVGIKTYAMIHHLGANSAVNGSGIDFSFSKITTNSFKDGWNHVTIEYIPNSDGKTAEINYRFRDKTYFGTAKKPEVEGTADVNLDTFHLNGSKKLRYGFTASTGNNSDITDAVIFESMPSLVDAEDNSYVVNKTDSTRIGNRSTSNAEVNQNVNLFDDQDANLPTSKYAHPGDKLTFNYMLHFLSGEIKTDGVNANLTLPDNVTLDPDDKGEVGAIYYRSFPDANGKVTTESVPISKDDVKDKKFSGNLYDLGHGGTDSNWESARIALNVTADSWTDSKTSLNVPASLVHFEGTNFISDVNTDSFDIVKPANELQITTDMKDPTEVKLGNKFNLTGDISFKNPETVNKNDMYINYKIDDGPIVRSQDTSAGSNFTIYDLETGTGAGQLDVGDHTIEVQVIDNNYPMANGGVDTIASNKLDYHIKVTNQTVTVTPHDSSITVDNNEPLTLTGTYEHADGTSTAGEGGSSVIAYTITTADGTTQSEVSDSQANDGKYSLTLDPYAYKKDPSVSLDDYTGNTGLKVGKNIVSITVVDEEGHKSKPTEVTVNVPDITPSLTTKQDEFSIVQGDPINMTANVNYGNNYQFTPSKLTWYVDANGHKTINSYSGDESVATLSQDFTIDSTANGIDDDANNPYTVSVYFTDPYGRKSEELDYKVDVMEKTAMIESTDYKFKDINASASPRVIGRDGAWKLQVKSVMSKWTLTAKAGQMTTDQLGGDVPLDGSLIYVSPDDDVNDMRQQTFIQNNTDDSKIKTTDIGGSWEPDEGVLLDVNSSTLAGTYSGEVEWDLTNSV